MNEFYVYLHVDPRNNETVYVGKGHYGRAWDVTRCRSQHHQHQAWMKELSSLGYLPTDWVQILHKNLTEQEAFSLEKEYLHKHGVLKFCRQSGERQHQSKLTDAQALEAYRLVTSGKFTHKEIANQYGVSRSAISMLASGKQWKAVTAGVRYEDN
jgi:predicted DNA-binding protein (UPF0251 family)